jgi:hypothetical protein
MEESLQKKGKAKKSIYYIISDQSECSILVRCGFFSRQQPEVSTCNSSSAIPLATLPHPLLSSAIVVLLHGFHYTWHSALSTPLSLAMAKQKKLMPWCPEAAHGYFSTTSQI